MKNLARIVIVSSLFLFAGCAGTSSNAGTGRGGADAMMNANCVVSGEALEEGCPTVDYMGGKVGFCCDKCIAKWNALDADAKKTALAKAPRNTQGNQTK